MRDSRRSSLPAFLALEIGAALSTFIRLRTPRERTEAMRRLAQGGHDVEGLVGHERGRLADSPGDMPSRAWRDILLRLKDQVSNKNVSLIAAGMAFYAFIAVPSIISSLIALYGLVFDVNDVERQVQAAAGVVPEEVITLLADQLRLLTSRPTHTLGIGLAISLALALWSSNSTSTSLMAALNIVYGEQEKRGLLRFYASALALTVVTVLLMIVSLALVAVLPAILDFLPLGSYGKTVASVARWPVLLVMMVFALAVAYRFAPSRQEPRWRWVTWGAVAAAVLWLIASALFSLYVGRVASYNKTYGSLAGVVVLLMWLYVSGYVVLLGAALNAELEHQTARDSTTGPPMPMGKRGAYVADTLGELR